MFPGVTDKGFLLPSSSRCPGPTAITCSIPSITKTLQQRQQQSPTPLGEVNYMNRTMSLSKIKNQNFKNIKPGHDPLNYLYWLHYHFELKTTMMNAYCSNRRFVLGCLCKQQTARGFFLSFSNLHSIVNQSEAAIKIITDIPIRSRDHQWDTNIIHIIFFYV